MTLRLVLAGDGFIYSAGLCGRISINQPIGSAAIVVTIPVADDHTCRSWTTSVSPVVGWNAADGVSTAAGYIPRDFVHGF